MSNEILRPEQPSSPEFRWHVGDKVIIPESYLSRGLAGYIDQIATGWVIKKIIERPDYGYGSKPYAIVEEDNEKFSAASKHIPLEELKKANP